MGLGSYFRLAKAVFTLSREGAFSLVDTTFMPKKIKFGIATLRIFERRAVKQTGRVERLSAALNKLGPTYVKFGQTLATRPDIVGDEIASDLSVLQDAMAPFDQALVPKILKEELGVRADSILNISTPIAAASIAQVHKCQILDANGVKQDVAVKILRPGIEQRFQADIKSFYAGARLVERLIPAARRLKPVGVIQILDHSARLELDLRFEAAAISEFYENTKDDVGFDIPDVHWEHTAQRVLTTSFMDGIGVNKAAELTKAGIDRQQISTNLMQSFLRHAIRDGFFHADMHPGNLFVDPKNGHIQAVDFGIMGRISKQERRFLAEILYGFITRNYTHISELHFEIGYVPKGQSVEDFALALRMIGEPMHGRKASDISMAVVFGQLLKVTEIFDMHARPELVLLQKNMALVEGVGRMLDPDMDIWTISEPIVEDWLKRQAGPLGKLEEAKGHFQTLVTTLGEVPKLVDRANDVLLAHKTELERQRANNGRGIKMAFGVVIILLSVLIWRLW